MQDALYLIKRDIPSTALRAHGLAHLLCFDWDHEARSIVTGPARKRSEGAGQELPSPTLALAGRILAA
jgi:hypothetical protein